MNTTSRLVFGARTGAVVTGWPIGGDYAGYVKMPGSDIIFCVGAVGSEDGDLVLNELAQLPSCETSVEIDGGLEICTGRDRPVAGERSNRLG